MLVSQLLLEERQLLKKQFAEQVLQISWNGALGKHVLNLTELTEAFEQRSLDTNDQFGQQLSRVDKQVGESKSRKEKKEPS